MRPVNTQAHLARDQRLARHAYRELSAPRPPHSLRVGRSSEADLAWPERAAGADPHRLHQSTWLVAPRSPLEIAVAWTQVCSRDRVAKVRVSIEDMRPSFTIKTGKRRRLAPCRTTVRAGPLF